MAMMDSAQEFNSLDTITQQIDENDEIKDIRLAIQHSAGATVVDQDFYVALIKRLIVHLSKATDIQHAEYSTTITDIFELLESSDPGHAQLVIDDMLDILKELLDLCLAADEGAQEFQIECIPNALFESLETMLDAIIVLLTSCISIIALNSSLHERLCVQVWYVLPKVMDLALEGNQQSSIALFTIAAQLYRDCVEASTLNIGDIELECIVLSLLYAMKFCKSIPTEIADGVLNDLSDCLHVLFENYPMTDIQDFEEMANTLESLQHSITDSETKEPLMRIACLLVEKGVDTPWLVEYLKSGSHNKAFQTRSNVLVDHLNARNNHVQGRERHDAEEPLTKRVRVTSADTMDVDQAEKCAENDIMDAFNNLLKELMETVLDTSASTKRLPALIQAELLTKEMHMHAAVLFQPYDRPLAQLATSCLLTNRAISEKIASLYDLRLVDYIRSRRNHILPFVVNPLKDRAELNAVADILGLDPKVLCDTGAHHVLVDLLQIEDETLAQRVLESLCEILNLEGDPKELLIRHQTKTTSMLVMEFGWPEKHEKAYNALIRLWTWCGSMPERSFAELLSVCYLGILHRVSMFISEVRSGNQVLSYPRSLEALDRVIQYIGPDIAPHALQSMSIFQTVSELPNMQEQTFKLWERFISVLPPNDLISHISTIVRGLLSIVPSCNKELRKQIADLLTTTLQRPGLSNTFNQLPDIPPFEELESVRTLVHDGRISSLDAKVLDNIIQQANSSDMTRVMTALEELRRILKNGGSLSKPVIDRQNELYTVLLHLSRKRIEQNDIRRVAADCLGLLGATDPSQLNVKLDEPSVVVLKDYQDEPENRDFICDLIEKQLIPAFHAASTERLQFIQYAIQMLLRHAGFMDESIHKMKPAARNRWLKIAEPVRDLLTPLLRSSFEIIGKITAPTYPIYTKAKDFNEWIKGWYYRLMEAAEPVAKALFSACAPAIDSGNIALALYLFPHLFLHVLLSGDETNRAELTNELLTVLTINARENSHSDDMTQASLQLVVLVTEHCRKWIQRTQTDLDHQDRIENVRNCLGQIPDDLMAMASFRSKAYAQALMHLELHIKASMEAHGSITSSTLDILRRIYANVNDMDDLSAVFSLFKRTLSIEEEITMFECSGKWDNAKICYSEILSRHPENSQTLDGYFRCLRESDDYVEMISQAERSMENHPKWLSKLNTYMAEAAWKMGSWDTLEQASKRPIEPSFDGFLARALFHIREQNYFAAFADIQIARQGVIETLSTVSMDSYQQSYDSIFRLQLLQELEDAQNVWETVAVTNNYRPIKDLYDRWEKQFNMVAPSFSTRTYLLDLRRTVLCELRSDVSDELAAALAADKSKFWLLKAKTARKSGKMTAALQSGIRAELHDAKFAHIERAKWYWKTHDQTSAIQYLQSKSLMDGEALLLLAKYSFTAEKRSFAVAKPLLKTAVKMHPEWERVWYYQALFYEKWMGQKDIADMSARSMMASRYIVSKYCHALMHGSKYFFHTMPRLLTLWMQLGDQTRENSEIHDPQTRQMLLDSFAAVTTSIRLAIDKIRPYQFCMVLPLLVSRLSHPSEEIGSILITILSNVITCYPRTAVWSLQAPLESTSDNMRHRTKLLIEKVKAQQDNQVISTIIDQARDLTRNLKSLADFTTKYEDAGPISMSKFPGLSRLKNIDLYIPKQNALIPRLSENIHPDDEAFPDDLPKIAGFDSQIEVMRSLQQPKRIVFIGDDGKRYSFLCKRRDDLRSDARMMEFSAMINTFLKKDARSRQRRLYIRTYAVIPLGNRWGLIEWINNLNALKAIVTKEWRQMGIDIRQINHLAKSALENKRPEHKAKIFTETILPKCPAVFYKWFLQKFPEPSHWLACRSRYTKTLAVMSIVGHIVGLGDRHAENILFDQTNGDCVHVDVNMLFDKGLGLTVPEVVPFRLTKNLIDAMGPIGYDGTFRKTCEVTLEVMRANKTQLVSVFETLVHDPLLEWSKSTPTLAGKRSAGPHPEHARREMEKIKQKINVQSSVQDQVQHLISEASSNSNLAQMFIGWAAFI